jgi:hypothetical protein
MEWESLQSRKMVALAFLFILALVIASAFIPQESRENSKENVVERIEFQDRQGNVATTKVYIVKLADGSELRYSKTIPGPGRLCDTNNPKGNCETETEPGYTEIKSAISSSEYRKQEEDFSTYYYPENRKCATQITERNIKISDCS